MKPVNSTELEHHLQELVRAAGGDYPIADLRDEMANTLREIRADEAAHGEDAAPFFSFSIWRGVAVFTVYTDGLDIYVVPCAPEAERALIGRFEHMAMTDTEESLEVLARDFGKGRPDIVVDPRLTSVWLQGP